MTTPIIFDNAVFAVGHIDFQTGGPSSSDTVSDTNSVDATLNGTVNNIGDTVTLSFANTSYTLTATAYDNPNMIEFTGAGGVFYVSNSPLANGQKLTFQQDNLQSYSVCFRAGTAIQTCQGEISVEHLQIGTLVETSAGLSRVRWLGHRTISCRNHPHPQMVLPVRILAHAFGANRPSRDLYLSPGHPVLVGADDHDAGGYLVPIMCLINGTSIERIAVDEVTYWHVELDEHDVVRANGLPAESYIDLGSRSWFAGADGPLYDPDMAIPGRPGRCRPVAVDGPVVEAERRRLDAVFATSLCAAAEWPDLQDAGPAP